MAKSNKKPRKPSVPKKRRSRKGVGLKRYNKILSVVTKDLKKQGLEYDLKLVRKEVSNIYPSLKDIPPSRLGKKVILGAISGVGAEPKEREDTYKIKAQDVPREYFDAGLNWYEFPEKIIEFNKTYPEIPIVIQSEEHTMKVEGDIGEYSGSILQEYVELWREEFENSYGEFIGTPAWADSKDKQFAYWGNGDVDVPDNMITDFEKVEPKVQKEIDKREKQKEDDKKKKKQDKKKLPKDKEKKKQPPKEESKSTEGELSIKRNIISDLRQDKKDLTDLLREKILTKKEYFEQLKVINEQISDVTKQLKKGGKL